MAGVDVGGGGGRPTKKAVGTVRRPKKRMGIRIDMTPMVDIAFLLLIFYMVTTVFGQPQAMEVSLPPDTETEIEIGESRLLTLRVDAQGGLYWNMGKDTPQPLSYNSLFGLLRKKNEEIPKLVTFVKIDKKAKYSKMVDVIDEIQQVERWFKEDPKNPKRDPKFSYRFSIAPFSEYDRREMEKVKGGASG